MLMNRPRTRERDATPRKRSGALRQASRYLSPAHTIYLFRCDGSGPYAFTADPKGHILPPHIFPRIHWRFEHRVTFSLNKNPKEKMVRAILDAIVTHGFHLTHAAVNAELLAQYARDF
jgi:hypothetical protein